LSGSEKTISAEIETRQKQGKYLEKLDKNMHDVGQWKERHASLSEKSCAGFLFCVQVFMFLCRFLCFSAGFHVLDPLQTARHTRAYPPFQPSPAAYGLWAGLGVLRILAELEL